MSDLTPDFFNRPLAEAYASHVLDVYDHFAWRVTQNRSKAKGDGFLSVTPAEWQNMRDMFAHAENAVLAIRPGGKGDVTRTHVAWKSTRSF